VATTAGAQSKLDAIIEETKTARATMAAQIETERLRLVTPGDPPALPGRQ